MKLKFATIAVLASTGILSPLYVRADISVHATNYRNLVKDGLSIPFLVKSDVLSERYHSSKTEIALAAHSDVAQADFFEDEVDINVDVDDEVDVYVDDEVEKNSSAPKSSLKQPVSGGFFNDSAEKTSKKLKAPAPEALKAISVEPISDISDEKDVVVEKKQENLPPIEAADEIETLEKVASEEKVEKESLPTEVVLPPIKPLDVKDVKTVEKAPIETPVKDIPADVLTIEGLKLPIPVSVVPMHFIEDGIEGYSEKDYPSEAVPASNVDLRTFAPIKVGGVPEEGKIICIPINKSLLVDISSDVTDIIVSNPNVVDINKMNTTASLLGRGVGSTNILMLDKKGKIISRLEVEVKLDVDTLKNTIEKIIPGERIDISSVNSSIVLSGSVRSDTAASNARQIARRFVEADEDIVNLITVIGDQQVLLRVRVSEMNRTILKELGVRSTFQQSWDGASGYVFNWGSALSNGLNAGGLGSDHLYGASLGKGRNFSSLIQALENTQLVKTLAEPNLTTVSGETANLLAGGEYPIPKFDSDGNVTIEFRPYGISMAFSPVVLSSGRINLKMSIEVSAIAGTRIIANITVPEMTTRRFNSTVEMPSGGSLMIGGLLQNDIASTMNGVPGIKDTPILGALFRSEAFQRKETELVVTVSSYIVEPKDPNSFASPTDGFVPSGDLDRIFFGKMRKVYSGGVGNPEAEAIEGPIGYIME